MRRVGNVGTDSGSSFATITVNEPLNETTNNLDYLCCQVVVGPLPAISYDTSQTFTGQIRAAESAAGANARAQVTVRVLDDDESTILGTLVALDTGSNASEFATSLTNREFPRSGPVALAANVSAPADHYLLIEFGSRNHNTQTNARTMDFRIGEGSANDLTGNDETSTTDNNPWFEFDFDFPVAVPDAATGDIIATDAFTGSDGTELSAYDADWSNLDFSASPTDDAEISDANRVRPGPISVGLSSYAYAAATLSAEYDVRADIVAKSTTGAAGVVARVDGGDIADAYLAIVVDGAINLIGPGFSVLGSVGYTVVDETTHGLELRIRDGEKAIVIDGVGYINSSNNTNTVAGDYGIVFEPATGNSNAADLHIDNFEVQDVDATPVTSARPPQVIWIG